MKIFDQLIPTCETQVECFNFSISNLRLFIVFKLCKDISNTM